MFALLFALAPHAGQVIAPAPLISGAAVAHESFGACGAGSKAGQTLSSASIRVSWVLTNPAPNDYYLRVYENGSLVATLSGADTFWVKTIAGSVDAGHGARSAKWFSNWTYRIDIVRKVDQVVVGSATTAPWVNQYGSCGFEGEV
ncbi:MAG TPA: hypothetical protein VF159_03285 [Gemmatimonadaceae bacterium]